MKLDLWQVYRHIYRSRLFEEAVASLWNQGLISGEMHQGTGEEAIIAGTVLQLEDGDAMALDHRGTSAMLMRGVDPLLLMRELLGRPDGLCRGMGGHMHLFSPEKLVASSGIVGASGPAAVGFALAARYLRPGKLSLAFFGEGAINEGMMMEAMNLASAWKLPVVFICKNNGWSITTRSSAVTAGQLVDRARGFGIPAVSVDGADVKAVWQEACEAMVRARTGGGPTFIEARCRHFDGHYLGYQLLRISARPVAERDVITKLLRSMLSRKGASLGRRMAGLTKIVSLLWHVRRESSSRNDDPLRRTRKLLNADDARLKALETGLKEEIEELIVKALGGTPPKDTDT